MEEQPLTEEETNAGLKMVVRDGLATQAMVTLTGGVFLVAFALQLGASNLVIGLLASIPPLLQLVQIPSIYLVERYRNRRRITMYSTFLSRVSLLMIILIPLLLPPGTGLIFLIVGLLTHTALGAIGSCSWNSWMRDLVPETRLGTFFSGRMRLATGLGIVLSLAAGFFIDWWKATYPLMELQGYSYLFLAGMISGLIGIYFISRIPEPRMQRPRSRIRIREIMLSPFRDANFRKLIYFMGSWNLAINLAAPFFVVYMLTRIGLDISLIIVLMVISQVSNILFLRLWGRFSDRFSNKSVLKVSGPMFLLTILAWTFTTLPDVYFLTLPLLVAIHILMGISLAGVVLASGNIGLKLAPKGEATSYLAANSFVNSLTAGISPIVGGFLADFFASRELSWTLAWTGPSGGFSFQTLNLQYWDFLFIIAFLIGLYSLHRLSLVREVGEVEEIVVMNELIAEVKKPMREITTMGGVRNLMHFPFSTLRTTLTGEKRKPPSRERNR